MKITRKELETILNLFLTEITLCLQKEEFDLSYSTFWVTMFDEGQKLEKPEPTVADLRDDLENLLKRLQDKEMSFSYNDYESLGNVIKAIGYTIYKKNRTKQK